MKKDQLVVRTLSGIDVGEVPEEIPILPMGHVSTRKGDFEVDDVGVASMIRQFKARRLDLVIDYEHQTLDDVQAPASGWIKDLYAGKDALMAKVEWTQRGREYIANKEYRYLSPVVLVTKQAHRADILHSAALTNTPAIDGMFAIINSDDLDGIGDEDEKENVMELEKLIKLLGLEENATEEDVWTRLTEIIEKSAKDEGDASKKETKEPEDGELVANKTVLELLGLPQTARTEDVTAMIMSFKAGDVALKLRVEQLEKQEKTRKADKLVEMALTDGKISAAQKDWAITYALSDPKGFELFAEKAPAVVPMGKLHTAADDRKKTDVDMMILKDMGVTKDDLKKFGGNDNE